jgi:hypothetical protein
MLRRPVPREMRWLFWDAAGRGLDVERHADGIIPRVLEHGRMVDVVWLLDTYGKRRIHRFLRETGHPELAPRTLTYWRHVLRAEDEVWVDRRASRPLSAAPWIA